MILPRLASRGFCDALHVYRYLIPAAEVQTPASLEAVGKLADREIKAGRMLGLPAD